MQAHHLHGSSINTITTINLLQIPLELQQGCDSLL